MQRIEVSYHCPVCALTRTFRMESRGVAEDVKDWWPKLVQAVMVDHREWRPECKSKWMVKLVVPHGKDGYGRPQLVPGREDQAC